MSQDQTSTSTAIQESKPAAGANLDQSQLFTLREAIARCGEAFAEFRSGTGAGAATPPWDAIVLTCATESQAVAAREELARRQALGLFPEGCTLLALPDPPGRRAGSGGATLLALEALATLWTRGGQAMAPGHSFATGESDERRAGLGSIFEGRRVLLVHSGGESQRLPAYAALGKIFAPLPVLLPQSSGSAIFDWLYLLASAIPGAPGEVTLLSGDVLPVFNPARAHRAVQAPLAVRGVALPAPAATGRQFGVYVPDPTGAARVILQKPSLETMQASGAVDADGSVLVDTGIVTLGTRAVAQLLGAAGLLWSAGAPSRAGSGLLPQGGAAAPWDLYRDYLPLLAREPRAIETPVSPDVAQALATATGGLGCVVAAPAEGVFVHLGTSRDFHAAVGRGSLLRTLFPFSSQRESAVESGAETAGAFVGRSLLGRETRLSPGAVVDHCRATGSLDLGADAMASGLDVPAGCRLRVHSGRVCYQTVLCRPASAAASGPDASCRVTVALALDDNPKLTRRDATFNSQPLDDWMMDRSVTAADLWTADVAQTLWEARLFVADAKDPDYQILEWVQSLSGGGDSSLITRHSSLDAWRAARRYSLRELLEEADATAVAAWRARLVGDIAAARIATDVRANGDASFVELFAGLTHAQRDEAQRQVTAWAEDEAQTPDPLHQARYWRVLADLAAPERVEGTDVALREAYMDRAAAAVREAVSRSATAGSADVLPLRPGARARVESPVRIDFGGGWTDTPPFSLERGGAVFNAALSLDGQLPVTGEAEVLDEPRLVIASDDLDDEIEVTSKEQAAGYSNPSDPFSLAKACLVLTGVLNPGADGPLTRLPSGLGLRVRTGSRVPRGSGLGGSSVVGAALLRALGEVLGRPQDDAELSRQTLELEQLMTTGGGWQDQMGAIAPGVKLVRTEPGLSQDPVVEPVPLSTDQLAVFDSHLVVAYTGHHRLAKNILRQVVMRYLGRDPLAMQALYQLRLVAGQLARAAAALDLELFGTLVSQAWLLNKTLDPQTSYPAVERLFSALAPHIYGAKLVGAGGGGFLIAITRQPNQQALVSDLMARDREFAYGYVVQHRIWQGGLRVTSEGAS